MISFENLTVWKQAHEIVLEIFKITKSFPDYERFRLTNQLCRAASSIPANICEGRGRGTDKDFANFLCIARGSLFETKYYLILAKDLRYIEESDYYSLIQQCDSIGKLLNSFIKKLRL
jgi:four helix bundle protein